MRTGWVGQTHIDLLALSANRFLLSYHRLKRSHQANAHSAEVASASECERAMRRRLCVFADVRATTKHRYGTRLGRHKEMEQMGFNVITLLPFVEFPCGEAKPKISFLFLFPLRGGGVGGGDARKMQGNFLVLLRRFSLRKEHYHFITFGLLSSPSSRRPRRAHIHVWWQLYRSPTLRKHLT